MPRNATAHTQPRNATGRRKGDAVPRFLSIGVVSIYAEGLSFLFTVNEFFDRVRFLTGPAWTHSVRGSAW